MERCQEFIGVRCIEAENVYGEGKHLYNMHLTDTEIIRCRDCGHSRDNGERCEHWANKWEDAWIDPDGFCAWAERDA